ncbi:GntR family transcriptional regulator [Actinomycetaceae bacterium WB03_NA08]|uniref:GntR family transcriptional regulator n=1 Tax=Scrofimicrobium canadense TaxID=2652290 RepID=A0A6N7W2F7_9ACTO|nr:GntR family transcriptional regulator [Scrofimicrobium canadense]MSS83475.1 GntR family transcriptional regulator [Scrofimicrobium canadense]
MIISVDPTSNTPLFEQIASAVQTQISAGKIHAGDRLPSAKQLALALDINLHTVLHAYQVLREQGLVTMRRGSGAVISSQAEAINEIHRETQSLAERAHTLGLSAEAVASLFKEAYRGL